ncbi:MAG: nitroreductase family protein [Octadecabacter sp.]|mgnify:FL=1|jgi:iodotyrosine deiodinase|nr:nitroreductase family protein [Octadecabacter sp.]MDC0013054.1 nitroreductase family protein [Octadecabacter sp.]MDC1229547.1 nitroreductase family protein [Octadecabacter sp.]MDC1381448.1 nitroreductase family protein [Octadecabacter sp.]MDC1398089.1 nitroreductase family protein [Octadecabacter sp.]
MTDQTPPQYQALALPDRADYTDAEMLSQADGFYAHIKTRHTIRDYIDRLVPKEVIEACVLAAGTAPSGANQQPWHFVAISNPNMKSQIRAAAEAEEEKFYDGAGGDAWLKALEPIGTDASKPHLDIAPWLIVVFAQRWGYRDGERIKHYYVPESVGIATGMLITALHTAGLSCLTHTPNPMKFLNELCNRPDNEKPIMILAVGHPADTATVPAVAKKKKPLVDILTTYDGDI